MRPQSISGTPLTPFPRALANALWMVCPCPTRRREGVVMKLCNAPYGLNDRTEAWVKLKPDYMEGVSETLDVVIVGGYLGQGTVRLAVWTFVCALFGVFTALFCREDGLDGLFPISCWRWRTGSLRKVLLDPQHLSRQSSACFARYTNARTAILCPWCIQPFI